MMSTVEKITFEVEDLATEYQSMVLDFVQFIKSKEKLRQERNIKNFSLSQAMKGMEDEADIYDLNDIKESIK